MQVTIYYHTWTMSLPFEFCYLNTTSASEILALRTSAYSRDYGKLFQAEKMKWTGIDDSSLHLGLRDGDTLVSILRLSFFKNPEKFYDATLIEIPEKQTEPYSLLSRAATADNYLKIGLHSELRSYALQICLYFNFFSVFASIESEASRFNSLVSLGYTAVGSESNWNSQFLKSKSEVFLLNLQGEEKIMSAVAQLSKSHCIRKLTIFPTQIELI